MLGITPFQYNPVTKELIVYRDLQVQVDFVGGNGKFGEDRLRSRWFDPILFDNVLNSDMLPAIDYGKNLTNSLTPDYEYVIIRPNNPEFAAWADTIKNFRIKGIPHLVLFMQFQNLVIFLCLLPENAHVDFVGVHGILEVPHIHTIPQGIGKLLAVVFLGKP